MVTNIILIIILLFIIFISVDIEIEPKSFIDYNKKKREAIIAGQELLKDIPCSKKLLKSYLKSKGHNRSSARAAIKFLNMDDIVNAKKCANILYELKIPVSTIWNKLRKYGFSERTVKRIFIDLYNQLIKENERG